MKRTPYYVFRDENTVRIVTPYCSHDLPRPEYWELYRAGSVHDWLRERQPSWLPEDEPYREEGCFLPQFGDPSDDLDGLSYTEEWDPDFDAAAGLLLLTPEGRLPDARPCRERGQ